MSNTASIYALTGDASARAESAAWARFSTARDHAEFCSSWLAILCGQIEGVTGALVLLGPDKDNSFAPVAVWPDATHDLQYLGPVAQRTLADRRGVVQGEDGGMPPARDRPAHIGYPIEVSGVLHGAVVLDLQPCPEATLQRALRLLHWASAWLIDQFRQRALAEAEARMARMATAMEMVATAVQERRLGAAALAVANELAARLSCDRVSIGLERKGHVKVEAISHTASFDARMNLVRLIGNAMDEVLDLDTILVFPAPADDELGAIAHAELATELRDIAICSVPLAEAGQTFGVITLERGTGEPFDEAAIDLLRSVAGLLGPVLALKRQSDRGVALRLADHSRDAIQLMVGPRHPGAKLIALIVIVAIAFLAYADGTYRVGAKAVVEGAVQRAEVAPYDGHILQSFVRAGDTVRAGQELARLDDRDLKLERERLVAERAQQSRKQRQALVGQDRAGMRVLAAQIAQSDAQIQLIDDKMARAVLRAPFDGVVVSGDLAQLLGTPVQQGQLLFQVAPLDAYRVILEIDERDIADVHNGSTGALTLSSMTGEPMSFAVKRITPVSSQQDGRNFFRVEASLDTPSERIRPGMEGIAKVEVGERRLLWIWTHRLVDWVRAWTWRVMP